jgi:type IV secretory pathway TrbF-like protein/sugar phosphate permease
VVAFPELTTLPSTSAKGSAISRTDGSIPVPTPKSRQAILPRANEDLKENGRRVLLVFLPFAAGFYLSYLFRTINSLISGELISQLSLDAADLGLLTSVYFFTFAAAQLPVGLLLDRYGPRRIQSVLLLVAAGGAALFGVSKEFTALVLGRGLVGVGMAASLTAGLKAIVLWVPTDRVALASGYMVMLGTLGAVTATVPVETLMAWMGWQALFELLAGLTAVCAIATYLIVPDGPTAEPVAERKACFNLRAVYADVRFWRLAPLSATCIGTSWSLQSLWAASWLRDVERLERGALVEHLFVMAVAVSASALIMGLVANYLRRRGVGSRPLLASVAMLFIVCQLALVQRWPLPTHFVWALVAAVGAATVLSYSIQAEYVPWDLAGRANAALNVFQIGGAFVLQLSTGLIVQQWKTENGHYPAVAYQTAFTVNLVFQIVALLWFEMPRLQRFFLRFASATDSKFGTASRPPVMPHAAAASIWIGRVDSARAERSNWRLAALGSTALLVLFAVGLVISTGRSGRVAVDTIEVAHLGETRSVQAAPDKIAPSESEIAYFLARFVKNIRSLSIDPVVVRTNWIDAYNYVTVRAALALNEYARESSYFARIGSQAVRVNVIYVVRASQDSFEIEWDEEAYPSENAANIRRFRGIAEVVFNQPTAATTLRNPLGLFVNAFHWSQEN